MEIPEHGQRLLESDNILVCIINQKLFKAVYFPLPYAHGCATSPLKLVWLYTERGL
jgi:hypothetical protein